MCPSTCVQRSAPILAAASLAAVLAGSIAPRAQAASTTDVPETRGIVLDHDAQRRFAAHFAPVLLYHREERFFPCSPLFPLEAVVDDLTAASTEEDRRRILHEAMGTAAQRSLSYEARALDEKMALATVYYQTYLLREGDAQRVVVEYWLYYLENRYRATAGLLPFGLDTSHPNDLEHLFLILEPREEGRPASLEPSDYALAEILASAHDDKVPTNRYVYARDARPPRSPAVLVELGAHAMAPDVDGDGSFTTGVDSTNGKFVWGIRDRGRTWARHRRSDAEPRGPEAVVLAPGARLAERTPPSAAPRPAFAYRLEHVDALSVDYDALGLTEEDVRRLFLGRAVWFQRLFGRSDGSPEKLLLPRGHEDFQRPRRFREGYARDGRGPVVGYTIILARHTFFAGGRRLFVNDSRWLPDLMVEGAAFLTTDGRDYYAGELLGYYPIDAASKLFFGTGVLADSVRLRRRQHDWLVGVEFDRGPFRFRTALRGTGIVATARVDFRIYFVPW